MRPRILHLAIVLFGALALGCSGEGPLATSSAADRSLQAAVVPDLGGAWSWSNVEQLTLPAFVAEMFGIPVEGPITHVRCEGSGTMTLNQVGTSFDGVIVRTDTICRTKGGFEFEPSPGLSPPASDVVDGTIRGRSIHFMTVAGPLFSPHHGTIAAVENGLATELRATGRTIVPGHPQSPVPVDPPPGGTSKTILWEAVRP